MKKINQLIIMVTCLLCSCSTQQPSLQQTLSAGKWIDLSYDLSASTLYWPNNPTGFQLDTIAEGTTAGGFYYSTFSFCAPEHGGTHIDAPNMRAIRVGLRKVWLTRLFYHKLQGRRREEGKEGDFS